MFLSVYIPPYRAQTFIRPCTQTTLPCTRKGSLLEPPSHVAQVQKDFCLRQRPGQSNALVQCTIRGPTFLTQEPLHTRTGHLLHTHSALYWTGHLRPASPETEKFKKIASPQIWGAPSPLNTTSDISPYLPFLDDPFQ